MSLDDLNMKYASFRCRQAAKCRLGAMHGQAHNAPIMSVPCHYKPATRLLLFPMVHRVREEELNTAREKNIAENAGMLSRAQKN